MNARQRLHFETLLREERARIVAMLGDFADPPGVAGAPGDEFQSGTTGAGPDDDAAIIAREGAALIEVVAALRILRESPERYGLCVTCGRSISVARLAVVPATRHCERHSSEVVGAATTKVRGLP